MRVTIPTLATLTSAALLTGPAAADPQGWDLLQAITFEEVETDTEWKVLKTFPEGLRNGAEFTVTGYYVPVEAQAYVTQFLIVPDPADCPFCGSNGYGISLEVLAADPMPDLPEASEVTVTGTLELIEDTETYQFARLTEARLVDGGS